MLLRRTLHLKAGCLHPRSNKTKALRVRPTTDSTHANRNVPFTITPREPKLKSKSASWVKIIRKLRYTFELRHHAYDVKQKNATCHMGQELGVPICLIADEFTKRKISRISLLKLRVRPNVILTLSKSKFATRFIHCFDNFELRPLIEPQKIRFSNPSAVFHAKGHLKGRQMWNRLKN